VFSFRSMFPPDPPPKLELSSSSSVSTDALESLLFRFKICISFFPLDGDSGGTEFSFLSSSICINFLAFPSLQLLLFSRRDECRIETVVILILPLFSKRRSRSRPLPLSLLFFRFNPPTCTNWDIILNLMSVFFVFFGPNLLSKLTLFSPFWFFSFARFSIFFSSSSLTRPLSLRRRGKKRRTKIKDDGGFCSQLSDAFSLFLDADLARLLLFRGKRRGTARILVRKKPRESDGREFASYANWKCAKRTLCWCFFFLNPSKKKEKGARSL